MLSCLKDNTVIETESELGPGEAAAADQGPIKSNNMVSLLDFDLIKVIGRGSYAKVGYLRRLGNL